jgi:hypothetical protein
MAFLCAKNGGFRQHLWVPLGPCRVAPCSRVPLTAIIAPGVWTATYLLWDPTDHSARRPTLGIIVSSVQDVVDPSSGCQLRNEDCLHSCSFLSVRLNATQEPSPKRRRRVRLWKQSPPFLYAFLRRTNGH